MADNYNYDDIDFGLDGGGAQIFYKLSCNSEIGIASKPNWVIYNGNYIDTQTENEITGHIKISVEPSTDGHNREAITFYVTSPEQECDTKSIFIKQTGYTCSCDSISYFITSFHRTFPISGTGDEYWLLATGDTKGCGELSGVSNSSMVDPESDILVEKIGEYQYSFKAKVSKDTSGIGRSGGVTFFFKGEHDAELQPCDNKVMIISQDPNYCDCESGGKLSIDNNELRCGQQYVNYFAYSNCSWVFGETNDSWIHLHQGQTKSVLSLSTDSNRTGAVRTGTVHVKSIVDYDTEWGGGVVCDEKDVTITQKGCNTCDCDYLNIQCGGELKLDSHTTGEISVWGISFSTTSCVGDFYKDCSDNEPLPGDYRVKFCEWITPAEDRTWIDGDPQLRCNDTCSYCEFYLNINSENKSGFDRTVEFKVSVEYYSDHNTPGTFQWIGGCQDGTCLCTKKITQEKEKCECSSFNTQSEIWFDGDVGCEENTYIVAGSNKAVSCGYGLSGYTCDRSGNRKDYDFCYINKSSFDERLGIFFSENNTQSERDMYYMLFFIDRETGERVLPNCTKGPKQVTQLICSHSCSCKDGSSYVDRNGYDREFTFSPNGVFYVGEVNNLSNDLTCLKLKVDSTHKEGGQEPYFSNVELEDMGNGKSKIKVTFLNNISFPSSALEATVDFYLLYKDETQTDWTTCENGITIVDFKILKP